MYTVNTGYNEFSISTRPHRYKEILSVLKRIQMMEIFVFLINDPRAAAPPIYVCTTSAPTDNILTISTSYLTRPTSYPTEVFMTFFKNVELSEVLLVLFHTSRFRLTTSSSDQTASCAAHNSSPLVTKSRPYIALECLEIYQHDLHTKLSEVFFPNC